MLGFLPASAQWTGPEARWLLIRHSVPERLAQRLSEDRHVSEPLRRHTPAQPLDQRRPGAIALQFGEQLAQKHAQRELVGTAISGPPAFDLRRHERGGPADNGILARVTRATERRAEIQEADVRCGALLADIQEKHVGRLQVGVDESGAMKLLESLADAPHDRRKLRAADLRDRYIDRSAVQTLEHQHQALLRRPSGVSDLRADSRRQRQQRLHLALDVGRPVALQDHRLAGQRIGGLSDQTIPVLTQGPEPTVPWFHITPHPGLHVSRSHAACWTWLRRRSATRAEGPPQIAPIW